MPINPLVIVVLATLYLFSGLLYVSWIRWYLQKTREQKRPFSQKMYLGLYSGFMMVGPMFFFVTIVFGADIEQVWVLFYILAVGLIHYASWFVVLYVTVTEVEKCNLKLVFNSTFVYHTVSEKLLLC